MRSLLQSKLKIAALIAGLLLKSHNWYTLTLPSLPSHSLDAPVAAAIAAASCCERVLGTGNRLCLCLNVESLAQAFDEETAAGGNNKLVSFANLVATLTWGAFAGHLTLTTHCPTAAAGWSARGASDCQKAVSVSAWQAG